MPARQVFRAYEEGAPPSAPPWHYCPVCATPLARAGGGALACSACLFRHYANPMPAVSVLVVNGERFAAVRRAAGDRVGAGRWCLPCGYVDAGEDFLTAARREVREETGLEVRIAGLLSVVSNFLTPDLHSLVAVLLARPISGELRAGDDAAEAGWFGPGDPVDWAFEADRHIAARWFAAPFAGAPVDPDHA